MLNAVNDLASADLQNVDASFTRTKDVIFILAGLKKVNQVEVWGMARKLIVFYTSLNCGLRPWNEKISGTSQCGKICRCKKGI